MKLFSFPFCKLKKKKHIQLREDTVHSNCGLSCHWWKMLGLWGLFLLHHLICCLHSNKNHGWKWEKEGEERTLCSCKFLCRCRARVTCFSAFFTSLSSSCSAWLVRSSWINSSRFSFPSNICIKSNQRDPQIRPVRRSWTAGSAPPFRATGQVYATEPGISPVF